MLSSRASGKRYRVAKELEIKDPRAVEPLLDALKELVFKSAVNAFAIGEKALMLLINPLNDSDENVRSRAAEALGEMEDERAVAPLINALRIAMRM